MNVRRNARTAASFKLLALMTVLMLLATCTAVAEETFTYQGTTLTLDPAKDKLSIRLTPQLLGLWETYYYTPDDAAQKELRTLLDELKLLNYTIDADKCKGCTLCARQCPAGAIIGKVKEVHVIDTEKCVKCGACVEKCKFGAISRQ